MSNDMEDAVRLAGAAAASGGLARIFIAMHGGERSWVTLSIEAGLGAMLGVIACAGAVYFNPDLWEGGRPLLILSGAAGCAGALGTRLLDAVIAYIASVAPSRPPPNQ